MLSSGEKTIVRPRRPRAACDIKRKTLSPLLALLLATAISLMTAVPARAASSAAEIETYSLPGETEPAVIESGAGTISVTVPYGTNATSMAASFTTSANITSIKVGDTPQVSGETANDFSSSVTYVVTAQNGSTKNWVVAVTVAPASSDATLKSLTINPGVLSPSFASYTSNYTVSVSNNVSSLTVTPTVNESHAGVTIDGSAAGSGSPYGPIELSVGTRIIAIVVTAEDRANTKAYSIAVTRAASSAAEIETYSLPGETGPAVIVSGAGTISVTVPYGTNATSMAASFTTSANITSIKVGDTPQVSGETANDFSSSVTYVVTAQNGSTKNWVVAVTVAPASSDATLKNLIISPGVLNPSFASYTSNYTVSVSNSVSSLTVTPTVNESHAGVTIDGSTVDSGSSYGPIELSVGTRIITIAVTAEDRTNTKAYSIAVTRAASSAAEMETYSLPGETGPAVIESGAGTISVTVAYGTNVTSMAASFTTSANITSIKVGDTPQVSGETANDFSSVVTYVVTAQNGSTKNWVVAVTVAPASSDATLKSLTINPGVLSPSFASYTSNYTVSVSNSVSSLTVTPTVNESHAGVTIDGSTVDSGSSYGPIELSVGTRIITIAVTAEDRTNTKAYSIAVTRAASSAAEMETYSLPGETGPAVIESGAGTISVTVPYGTNVTSMAASFTTSANITSIKVGDTPQVSGETANDFSSSVTYVVTAQNGSTKNWVVAVTVAPASSDATLKNLIISPGVLNPPFASYTSNYTVSVDNSVTSVMIAPTVNESHAGVTIDGSTVYSGSSYGPISLDVGTRTLIIVVMAQNGNINSYSIAVTRAASSAAEIETYSLPGETGPSVIVSGAGTISVTVPYGTNVTSMAASFTTSANITSIKVGDTPQVSGETANDFSSVVTYVVTAQNGSTKNWVVAVTVAPASSDATLRGLTIDAGTLTPLFASNVTGYAANVANGVNSVTVTLTVSEIHAMVKVNDVVVAGGSASSPINLNVGANTITIAVTAQDGITSMTYTVTVTRAASAQTGGFGGGFGGGGGGGAPSGPGVTALTPYTNNDGLFSLAAVARSEDGKASLSIAKGVLAKAKDGGPLKSVSVLPKTDPPPPPSDSRLIGLVYEFGPEGASFTPSVYLTLSYDPTSLPAGLGEKNLVLATWDATAGKWVELKTTVDNMSHTLMVSIGHLSVYGIIAHGRPSSFTVTNLSIVPGEVDPGKPVSVTVKIENSGDLTGSCQVTLRIDGATEATKEILISGGGMETAMFSASRTAAGAHSVEVNGITGSFTVRQAVIPKTASFETGNLNVTPASVGPGESVAVSFVVTNTGQAAGSYRATLKIDNLVAKTRATETKDFVLEAGARQTVRFDVVKTGPGVYVIDAGGLSGTFEVKKAEAIPERTINWYLIAGIIFAISAVATYVGFRLSRRSAYIPPVPPRGW